MAFNFEEALKNIDIEEFAKQYHEKLQKERKEREDFWNSALCDTMINDMLKKGEGFDSETFSYYPEKIKTLYNWNHISDENIKQFISVMSDSYLGLPENNEPTTDEDCSFDNYSFNKKSINIFIMIGQGSFIRLTPQTEK